MLNDPTFAEPVAPVAGAPKKRRTRSEELRRRLADDIVSGALEPGTPLDEVEFARRFGVSRTPIREAIRELSAMGLVQTRPHRGAVVALPTPDQLRDMFAVMGELEALCAGYSALHMTAVERRGLIHLHHAMATLARRGEATRYGEANEAFHNAVYAGTHNGYLVELTAMTRSRVAPFRRAQFRAEGRPALSHREHDVIVQAIARGDRAAAIDAMRDHIGIVYGAYREYAEQS